VVTNRLIQYTRSVGIDDRLILHMSNGLVTVGGSSLVKTAHRLIIQHTRRVGIDDRLILHTSGVGGLVLYA
jgi:hypothetical protein